MCPRRRIPPYLLHRPKAPYPKDLGPWRVTPRPDGLAQTEDPDRRAETDQIRAARNQDPREAEAGPLVASRPGYLDAPTQVHAICNTVQNARSGTARTACPPTRTRRQIGGSACGYQGAGRPLSSPSMA
jgi:hypothetical protein